MKEKYISEIREFNRFYTKVIGLLNGHILNSVYSLTEARILFELNQSPGLTSSDLIEILDIDKGYLSRILKKFEKHDLVQKKVSEFDRRVTHLSLSKVGKKEFTAIDTASSTQIKNIFSDFTEAEISTLVGKMKNIQELIDR